MSTSGTIIFYGIRKPPESRETIRRLIEWTGATDYLSAIRTETEDQSWEEFQAELAATARDDEEETDESEGPGVMLVPAFDEDYQEEMFQPPKVGLSQLPDLFQEEANLWIELKGSPWVDRIQEAIQRDIPSDIRGRYLPSSMNLRCGFHDIFESAEEGRFIARAFFSVNFFGYMTPSNGLEFEKLLAGLREVDQLHRELASIIGPTGDFIEWSY
jgi:hypothetical protein